MLTNTEKSPYAKVSPLSWNSVEWNKGFWEDVFEMCAKSTVPHLQNMFEDKDISHVVENFRICAGETQGEFGGTDFGDGDFYKWMESAMYVAAKTNDQELLNKLDGYIELIGRAQLDDGYISTKQILGERQQNGIKRFGNINDFEVYNFGHLFTSACLYKRITGKDNFMKIAEKAARYLENMYEENARTGKVQTAVCPSHYMGLVEMYRTTGEQWYLDLARLAVTLRDSVTDGTDDNQDRIPLKDHEKIVGHAVRSNYLYAGVADLYAEEGDEEYLEVLHKVWRNLMDTKIYITGGCGALYNGASPYGNFFIHQLVHQAYGYEYQLPNVTAYNETCASLGHVFWAYRMFQIEPQAEYMDALERAMLNVNLAAVSLDGKKYFYENMLRRAKKENMKYQLIWPLTRSEYILSYCCPPNLARTLAESSEYAYLRSDSALWLGMYGASEADVKLECGTSFHVQQRTAYPYDGRILLHISHRENDKPFQVKLRIPGWASGGSVTVSPAEKGNSSEKHVLLIDKDSGTYFTVDITEPGDTEITLDLDMPVRYTVPHTMVEETTGQAAVERGPLVYCLETPDADVESLDDLMIDLNAEFECKSIEIQGRTVTALEGDFYCLDRKQFDREKLYQPLRYQGMSRTRARLIPYFAWDNREYGEMRIWIPIAYK
ncbi:MAG: glycoside hydrolase family 127 protein [Eubacteriales bacterium]|nr:glycoside hydrolase family 127 protein [Eubacteriales bacterium]